MVNFEINEEDLEDFDGDRQDDFNNICALVSWAAFLR